jgi:hypothetical protein
MRFRYSTYSDSVTFRFSGSFEAAEKALSKIVQPRSAGATLRFVMHKDLPLEPLLVGTVTSSEVKLSRILPLHGNVFKPFFFGRFQVKHGHVELTGQFKMHPITVALMTFGWTMFTLAGLLALFAFLSGQEDAIYAVTLFY